MNKLILLASATLLTGCATSSHVLAPNGSVPKEESVVFGEVAVNPKISGLEKWLLNRRVILPLTDFSSSKDVDQLLLKGSSTPFYWHLPPGKYAFLNLEDGSGLFGRSTSWQRIGASFSVGLNPQLIYVGTLSLALGGGCLLPTVRDDMEEALKAMRAKYPGVHGDPVKQLLHLEKQR